MNLNLNDIYKCDCGALLEVTVPGVCDGDAPACCGKPMVLLSENVTDAAKEKHVPVITKVDGGYKVTVGSVPHPMTPEHWIVMIELIADGLVMRKNLTPTDAPEAVFQTNATSVKAREYCNLHGLWVASV